MRHSLDHALINRAYSFDDFFDPSLAVASFAASRMDSLAWFNRLLDGLNTGALASFTFDFA